MARSANPEGAPVVRVLVVGGSGDDVAAVRQGLVGADEPHFEVQHVADPANVADGLSTRIPGVVLVDLAVPPDAYRAVEERVHTASRAVPIVVIAEPEQEVRAWRAVRDGAQDYILRGRLEPELVRRVLRHAMERQRLLAELEHRVAELEASHSRFRTLIEKNADGVILADANATIRFVNPAAERLFGRRSAELVGEVVGFPIIAGETTEIDIVQRGGTPVTAELRAVETTWEGDGAWLISLRDITDRKRAEQKERELIREQAAREVAEAARRENERLYEEAQVANQAKSNFLAVMSHELRTPLNAIVGYTDLLLAGVGGALDDQQKKYLSRVQTSSQHLLQLVDEILTFARTEAGRENLELVRVELRHLLDEVAAIAEPLAVRAGLRFTLAIEADPLRWETDVAKVRQILLNLISNAVKFTSSGGVTLRATTTADVLRFDVEDTGSGIPEEHLEHIFEPFWQASQDATRTQGGTGLGLAVCRRLARLLGGDVSVTSRPGEGSTFTVHLPIAPAPADSAGSAG